MANERFMRHHYGASGYIPEKEQRIFKEEQQKAANERFEVMSELFKHSTGFLAPDKFPQPERDTQQYGMARELWLQWTDTKALDAAIKIIQVLRHNEMEHDKLYNVLINSDTNQLRQERDALRLRIRAVDQERIQLAEERKKMVDAYSKLENEFAAYKRLAEEE